MLQEGVNVPFYKGLFPQWKDAWPGCSGGCATLRICGSPVCMLGACRDQLVLLDISELACLESPFNV